MSQWSTMCSVWKQLDANHKELILGLAAVARYEQQRGRTLQNFLGWQGDRTADLVASEARRQFGPSEPAEGSERP